MRFRNKMAVYNITVALIPFVIFALLAGTIFIRQAQTTAANHTAQITGQVSSSIDTYISSIVKLADYISSGVRRSHEAAEADTDAGPGGENPGITRMLKDVAASHPEIAGILVAYVDDTYDKYGMTRISRDRFSGQDWYRKTLENPSKTYLSSNVAGRNIAADGGYSVDDVFSLSKVVCGSGGEVLAVVLIDVRDDIISDSINQVAIGENGFVFIIDENKEMVYTPQNNVVLRVNPDWLNGGSTAPFNVRIMNESYQIRSEYSAYTGWQTVGVFSIDEVMGSVNDILVVLMGTMLFTIMIVLFCSFRLATTVTKPISKLQSLMREAEMGNLAVRFNSLHSDEIGQLGRSFNHMIEHIDELIQQVYLEQRNIQDAQLKILREQIKPHFLYNTLDSISWMAREYEAADIVKLVDALTSMFRIGLSKGKDFITVREEAIHVKNYLYIQKIRYKEKLDYTVAVEPPAEEVIIPKLVLQPIVENAIYHGIKQKRGGGAVQVRAFLERGDEILILEVGDNGAGMKPKKLSELNGALGKGFEKAGQKGFGLYYIQKRIRLGYGAEYGITLESAEGEGTVVRVRLPAQNIEGGKAAAEPGRPTPGKGVGDYV
jgi:two-component system sensor histidine kinase YesM